MSAIDPTDISDTSRARLEHILGPHADSTVVKRAIERVQDDAALAAVWRWATAPFDPTTLDVRERASRPVTDRLG